MYNGVLTLQLPTVTGQTPEVVEILAAESIGIWMNGVKLKKTKSPQNEGAIGGQLQCSAASVNPRRKTRSGVKPRTEVSGCDDRRSA